MSHETIILLISAIIGLLFFMLAFIIIEKLRQDRRSALIKKYTYEVEGQLNELLYCPDSSYEEQKGLFINRYSKKIKNRIYFEVIEEMLIDCIDDDMDKMTERALQIAYDMDMPSHCLGEIKSFRAVVTAGGCRKAGLYRYTEAIPSMLEALSIFSSDTQLEILLALAIIGDISIIEEAFNKIQNMMFINDRGIAEILLSFSGSKSLLCEHMIKHDSEYVSSLFLKTLDADTAKTLSNDILDIMYSECGKEKRISAMKALGKTGYAELADHFIAALMDDDWQVRSIAAKILGDIVVPEAREPLATAVCDSQWWVRQNAATSLLRYPDCEELLLAVIKTGDTFAQESILCALDNAGRPELIDKMNGAAVEIPVKSESLQTDLVAT